MKLINDRLFFPFLLILLGLWFWLAFMNNAPLITQKSLFNRSIHRSQSFKDDSPKNMSILKVPETLFSSALNASGQEISSFKVIESSLRMLTPRKLKTINTTLRYRRPIDGVEILTIEKIK